MSVGQQAYQHTLLSHTAGYRSNTSTITSATGGGERSYGSPASLSTNLRPPTSTYQDYSPGSQARSYGDAYTAGLGQMAIGRPCSIFHPQPIRLERPKIFNLRSPCLDQVMACVAHNYSSVANDLSTAHTCDEFPVERAEHPSYSLRQTQGVGDNGDMARLAINSQRESHSTAFALGGEYPPRWQNGQSNQPTSLLPHNLSTFDQIDPLQFHSHSPVHQKDQNRYSSINGIPVARGSIRREQQWQASSHEPGLSHAQISFLMNHVPEVHAASITPQRRRQPASATNPPKASSGYTSSNVAQASSTSSNMAAATYAQSGLDQERHMPPLAPAPATEPGTGSSDAGHVATRGSALSGDNHSYPIVASCRPSEAGATAISSASPSASAKRDTRFHQPQLLVGRLATSTTKTNSASVSSIDANLPYERVRWHKQTAQLKSGERRGRKRRRGNRPDIRSLPNYYEDSIESGSP